MNKLEKVRLSSAIKRINTQRKYLETHFPNADFTQKAKDFTTFFPTTKSGNISAKGLEPWQINKLLYADRHGTFTITTRKTQLQDALEGYLDKDDLKDKDTFQRADALLDKLNEQIENFITNNYSELMKFSETADFLRKKTGKRKTIKELQDMMIKFEWEHGTNDKFFGGGLD